MTLKCAPRGPKPDTSRLYAWLDCKQDGIEAAPPGRRGLRHVQTTPYGPGPRRFRCGLDYLFPLARLCVWQSIVRLPTSR